MSSKTEFTKEAKKNSNSLSEISKWLLGAAQKPEKWPRRLRIQFLVKLPHKFLEQNKKKYLTFNTKLF